MRGLQFPSVHRSSLIVFKELTIPLYLPLSKREHSGIPPLSKGRLGGDCQSLIAHRSSFNVNRSSFNANHNSLIPSDAPILMCFAVGQLLMFTSLGSIR